MSERLARIISNMADELLQSHKRIDKLEYDIELAREYQDKLDAKVRLLTEQLAASQTEAQEYRGFFNDMHIFFGLNEFRDNAHVTKMITDIVKSREATIESREAEANSYRDLYDELKALVLIDGYEGRHNDLTHAQTLNYVKEERQISAELDKEYTKADNWKLKYRRLVECIKRLENEEGHLILSIHRETESKRRTK